ncbi:nicotinate-nucleotide adenylyltransferase [Spirochaetia bacterium]|nr:nicotinate-nucleotide adenylyltransferase [Spirochaetia bacterium]
MKLAILGGSFNPVHLGHLYLAEAVLSSFGYDRVLLIPAFQSPFKPGAEAPSPKDRLDMLAASIAADPRLTIDDCEIKREGVSYTIDTIFSVKERYGLREKPALILGDDLTAGFLQWRRAEEIAKETDIIIAHRISPQKADFPYKYRELNNEIMDISSALVRERIKKGGNWRYLVPAGARHLIEDRCLYGFSPQNDVPGQIIAQELIAEIEQTVRLAVSFSRFLHSRNTALLAWDLCRRYGLDPQAGYLAGIAHDICKSMPDDEQKRLALADGGGLSDLEKKKPGLLHGRSAAVLLRERFGVHNEDILEAVRCHTTGDEDMGPLAKVIYVADKIEISRENIDKGLREMAFTAGIEELFEAVLGETVAWLNSREMDVSLGTRRLLSAMQERKKP